ncbi:MAG: 6-carboxyhexanoate--CoA ligase [Nitrospirae bacterium]|nr:6-carboxyhexanoate--CoA ligase [Nitrospirota bacterium]
MKRKDHLFSVRMRASKGTMHISGAEGIYKEDETLTALRNYLFRAIEHDRGIPDQVIITVERLNTKPRYIKSLPVYTARVEDKTAAWSFIKALLSKTGISEKAYNEAYSILFKQEAMRGAALLYAKSATRVEPDQKRGVRARLIGITDEAKTKLKEYLNMHNLPIRVVTEALVLASKVLTAPHVIAELCVSDNPFYTTGYVSIRGVGYIRIPNIKDSANPKGGRVFFLKEMALVAETIEFLQSVPTVVNEISAFHGIINPNEILSLLDSKSCFREVL